MGSNVKGRKLRKNEVDIDEEAIIDDNVKKRIKPKKIKVFYSSQAEIEVIDDDKLDKELENEDNMSFALIVFILVCCFVVGIVVGYILYRVAINNSNTLNIVFNYLL